jgi:hypothetical protein
MIGNSKDIIKWLLNKDNELFEIKEYKQKRSLNANDYYWTLINKIANKLKLSKEELHLKMLKEYGQVAYAILPAEQNIIGYTKYFEEIKTIKKGNYFFKEYKLFKGSSEMNKTEFSILLDGVIYEAKELGIETLEDIKVKEMFGEWQN